MKIFLSILTMGLLLFGFQHCNIENKGSGKKLSNTSDTSTSRSSSGLKQPTFEKDLLLIGPQDWPNAQQVLNVDKYDTDKPYIIARHMGLDLYTRSITDRMRADLFAKTLLQVDPVGGVLPHRADFQTFLPTTMQRSGSQFGFVISTKDMKNLGRYKPVVGGGPHWIIGRDFADTEVVFSDEYDGISFSTIAAVPHAYYKANDGKVVVKGPLSLDYSMGQLSFVFYFKNISSDDILAVLVNFYEPQGNTVANVQHDTQVSFASIPMHPKNPHISLSSRSATYTDLPFQDKRLFEAKIGKAEMTKILSDIKDFRIKRGESPPTLIPSDYALMNALILFELPHYVANGESEVSVYLNNFTVAKNRATNDEPATNVCGSDWAQIGTFWCSQEKQYQRICSCIPPGHDDPKLWVNEGNGCYSHMTGNSCNVKSNCHSNWQSIGEFWCDKKVQHQRICTCLPPEHNNPKAWVNEGNGCYSHMTGASCE